MIQPNLRELIQQNLGWMKQDTTACIFMVYSAVGQVLPPASPSVTPPGAVRLTVVVPLILCQCAELPHPASSSFYPLVILSFWAGTVLLNKYFFTIWITFYTFIKGIPFIMFCNWHFSKKKKMHTLGHLSDLTWFFDLLWFCWCWFLQGGRYAPGKDAINRCQSHD